MRRVAIYAVLICAACLASAQIRIIPREKLLEAEPKAMASSLKALPETVDFGTIDEMSGVWQGSAEIVNQGAETIAITRIKSSCGCLQVELPKRVVAPKERVRVALKYYPRGHAGRVRQRVLLYTEASDEAPSVVLQVQGFVTASADRSDDYPYSRGVLRLRQERVQLQHEGRQVVRIACMNGGSTLLRPMVDAQLLPKGLKVHFEPSEFAPKQQGDMVVEYDGGGALQSGMPLHIYIKGLNLPPRQSKIEVVVED